MVRIKRLVLDVLKPHEPNSLEFARAVAQKVGGCSVKLTVTEMDDKTATTVLIVEGDDIRFEAIQEAVSQMGGSLHSIDEVEVAAGARDPD
ncbi:MAG: DUF211 domain-containing protein [Myxococcales bacterium]|nr:DUF211 domain-containing protein [Myxococcales bacterium]MDD9969017.1 DUF211 domain-containing protein [Myxococcales bacterium]